MNQYASHDTSPERSKDTSSDMSLTFENGDSIDITRIINVPSKDKHH